jgi:hypothetical protein
VIDVCWRTKKFQAVRQIQKGLTFFDAKVLPRKGTNS